jgi:hypothetical protein
VHTTINDTHHRPPPTHTHTTHTRQSLGRIHAACFSDPLLHSELVSKALFWQSTSFYGIDMTPLHQDALDGYFSQVRAPGARARVCVWGGGVLVSEHALWRAQRGVVCRARCVVRQGTCLGLQRMSAPS